MIRATIRDYRAEFGTARFVGECIAIMGFVVAWAALGVGL